MFRGCNGSWVLDSMVSVSKLRVWASRDLPSPLPSPRIRGEGERGLWAYQGLYEQMADSVCIGKGWFVHLNICVSRDRDAPFSGRCGSCDRGIACGSISGMPEAGGQGGGIQSSHTAWPGRCSRRSREFAYGTACTVRCDARLCRPSAAASDDGA